MADLAAFKCSREVGGMIPREDVEFLKRSGIGYQLPTTSY